MANLNDIVVTLDDIILPTDVTKVHNSTSWIVSKVGDFSDITYESLKDYVNIKSITIPTTILGEYNTVYIKAIVHYDDDTSDEPIIANQGNCGDPVTYSKNIVNPPTLMVGESRKYIGKLIIESGNFSMYHGIGNHKSTSYRITNINGKVLFEKLEDVVNKMYLPLWSNEMGKIMLPNRVYIVMIQHHSDTNEASPWVKTTLITGKKFINAYKK